MTVTKADLIEALKALTTPGDVTSPAEMREALREELDDLSIRPILKPTAGTDYSMGVGTPYLVEVQEEGIGPYILFTGWNTADGSNREVFVADINEDFNISNVRKLIAVGDPSADFTGHDTVSAIYNSFDGWWWLFTTSRYTPEGPFPNHVACAFRYNKTFTTRLSSHAPLTYQHNGSLIRTIDQAFCPIRGTGSQVFFAFNTRPSPYHMMGTFMPDISVVPPRIAYSPAERVYPHISKVCNPYSMQLMWWKDWMVILSEDPTGGIWNTRPVFIHRHIDYSQAGWPNYFMGIGGRTSEALIQPFAFHEAPLVASHPHATWLPNHKNLNLFFVIYPGCAPSFKHEIWAMRLPPERLDPRSYRAVTYLPWYGDTILANAVSRAFPGYGQKTIYFKSSVAGNLTIEVDPLGDSDWETYETFTNVTRIPPYIMTGEVNSVRLSFSVGATVTAKVILNPRG